MTVEGRRPKRGEIPLRLRGHIGALGAVALSVGLLTACSNAPDTATIAKGPTPGVTNREIDVGALATLSGPISADFAPIVSGVRAYFDWVNHHGGVWGRKVVLAHLADDGASPSGNATQARTLVQQDHVFAIVGVATAFFSAAPYLAQTGTPTFGYATQNDWAGPNNLFAAYGSVVDFSTIGPSFSYTAHQVGAKSVALLAYGVPQSASVCAGGIPALERAGIHIGYSDLSVPYGGDVSSDVVRMKEAKTDLVISCMDVTGNVELARTMVQNGLTGAAQLWMDGYNQSTLQAYSSLMNRTYFVVQHVPFEAAALFPGTFPDLERYLAEMHRFAPRDERSEVALEGWINADLFVQGLRAAGPHPTQRAVINAINEITHYDGGGLTTPINWTISHRIVTPPSCESYVVTGSNSRGQPTFNLAFNKGHHLWVCFASNQPKNLDHPVPPPAGSPGG